jgi:hypothetical protein
VQTSSINKTRIPASSLPEQLNASRTFSFRYPASSSICGAVARCRTSAFSSTGNPTQCAISRASKAA